MRITAKGCTPAKPKMASKVERQSRRRAGFIGEMRTIPQHDFVLKPSSSKVSQSGPAISDSRQLGPRGELEQQFANGFRDCRRKRIGFAQSHQTGSPRGVIPPQVIADGAGQLDFG